MRSAYQKAPQAKLALFTENVFNRMNGNSRFEAFQPLVEAMGLSLVNYKQALLAAENRGRSEVLSKNTEKQLIIQDIDNISTTLEITKGVTAQMIIDAGFTLQPEPAPPFKGKIPAPQIVYAGTTGRRGEINVELKNEFPRAVSMHAVKYSANRGESWLNGKYFDKLRFTLDGLPSPGDLWLCVKGLGKNGNESDWSEVFVVAVL